MTKHIHLIAVCGTAMGTLAGMLKAQGFQVSGSDSNVYPPMSTQLAKWGIEIKNGFSAENLIPRPDLVVVGNAVSKTNPEVEALLQSDIPYQSLPQTLAQFFLKDKKSLVVCGTHGKTTTTSLLAFLMSDLGLDPSFLVGGIPLNFDSSFQLGKGKHFVIEGDEYDTAFFDKGPKFWHYQPYASILTGVEFDHADIYRDLQHLLTHFEKFVHLIPEEGYLFYCADNENARALSQKAKCQSISYGLSDSAAVRASEIQFSNEGVSFQLSAYGKYHSLTSPLPGNHNLQNLLGVLALLLKLFPELQIQQIQESLLKFQSVKRRQEVRGVVSGVVVVDDFAHHPTAIAQTIESMKLKYPGQKIWAVFEPRSNSSKRNVFQNDFPKAFLAADEVLLAKVFMPEKVPEGEVLNVEKVAADIALKGIPVSWGLEVDEIVTEISGRAKAGDVVLIMSNGAFGGIHQKLLEALKCLS